MAVPMDVLAGLVIEPAGLLPARNQMALSLGWHIVLACFGVAFPAMIFVVHRRGLRRGDELALELAKRWSKVSAVLFAIGAVSGTVLSFEMGLLWPGLMGPFGDVLGLPFAFEGLSFFVEAIFLGIYLYGWGRIPDRLHLLMLVPMMAAGVVGSFCVLSVNAWMQNPTGFRLVESPGGSIEATDVDPWAAMFNDSVWLMFAHMWVGAFMVVGFIVAGVYAAGMLRGRRDGHHRLGFVVPFAFASVAALAQPLVGHVLGLHEGDRQPSKLAAFELAETTEQPAPLRLGGVMIDGEARYYVEIPKIGSLIARNSFDKPVPGLDTIPPDERPPVTLTHLAFQTMVGIGTLLALAVVALEAGWVATEVGRQPWVAYGVLRTTDAAGDSPWIWWSLIGTAVVYAGLTVGAAVVLRSMAARWRRGEHDLPSPYGPEAA